MAYDESNGHAVEIQHEGLAFALFDCFSQLHILQFSVEIKFTKSYQIN